MKFTIWPDNKVEINIVGYEYPLKDGMRFHDANWLNVNVKVKTSDDEWEVTDPAFLADEFSKAAPWLRSIARYTRDLKEINNIWACIEGSVCITHIFSSNEEHRLLLELRGEFVPKNTRDGRILQGTFDLTTEELEKLADEFEEQSDRFPVRDVEGTYYDYDEEEDEEDEEEGGIKHIKKVVI